MLTASLVLVLLLAYATASLYRRRNDAIQDRLTRLGSRAFFERVLQQCGARTLRRTEYGFAIFVVEIGTGQESIRRAVGRFGTQDIVADAAERLAASVRPNDVLARVGELRFAVLIDEVTSVTQATLAAERLLAALEEGTTLTGRRLKIATYAGLAMSDKSTPAAELMTYAERALEESKATARPYVLATPPV
jgi:diguanylate cyclase (GGDEF)-like protein